MDRLHATPATVAVDVSSDRVADLHGSPTSSGSTLLGMLAVASNGPQWFLRLINCGVTHLLHSRQPGRDEGCRVVTVTHGYWHAHQRQLRRA